ncbi:MAG: SDR family NAD(P)-dependent oxidoreductase [Cyanobacteria bacterium J06638_6]
MQTIRADLGTLDGIRAASVDLQLQINGQPVQYLVNGAGLITLIGPIHTIDLADFSRLMNINFFATFHLTNVLVPQFAEGVGF